MLLRACAIASAVALLAACGSDSADTTETTATPTEQGSSGILDITAPLVGGGELDLGQYAGAPVALWFWAPG